ncbi:signal peptide peptidase-like 2B isoform X1 [Dermacentor albipictus]|uniref:signal peptide peptidase-like 2B isoform X1 n=1 Tax=Dermacentor albipictus TaxID=60249 RepID=UPI0031FBD683
MASARPPRKASVGAASFVAAVGLAFVSLTGAQELAVVSLITPSEHPVQLCMSYYPEFKELPDGPDAAEVLQVISFTSQSSCDKPYGIDLKEKVVLIQDTGNCTLEKAMQIYKDARAYALIIALSSNKLNDITVEKTSSSVTDLVLIFAANKSAHLLKKLMIPKQPLPVKLFTKSMEVDPGLLVIWFLAVFSVGIGSYWSGNIRHQVYLCEVHKSQEAAMRRRRLSSTGTVAGRRPSRPQGMNVIEEESSLDVSPVWVLSFVVVMASMLVVLYLFIAYLVYFIHGMFALSSAVAILGVLEPLVYKVSCGTGRLPVGAVPCFHGSLEVRQALILIMAVIVPAVWVYWRHHPLSWIMQDVLGVCFSVYILRVLRLPSLKICTLLLSILFFYDIFFVFLTPHLIPAKITHNSTTSFVNASQKGDSIMVEVARGGGSKEQIPMVMRVPRFGNQDISACLNTYSLLGFGDILVPGLLLAFLRGFDLMHVGGCMYFPVALIFYGLGLLATFASLYLMRLAQPALMFLVPFTVLPTLLIARLRGEFDDIWNGNAPEEPSLSEIDVSHSDVLAEDHLKPTDPRNLVTQPVQPAFQPAGSYGIALTGHASQQLTPEKFL